MPISFVPKLKTSDERREGAHSTRTHHGTPPTTLPSYQIAPHPQSTVGEGGQGSLHPRADKGSEAQGG